VWRQKKYQQAIDGREAASGAESKFKTSKESIQHVELLRENHLTMYLRSMEVGAAKSYQNLAFQYGRKVRGSFPHTRRQFQSNVKLYELA
jgi:hypothetical protein